MKNQRELRLKEHLTELFSKSMQRYIILQTKLLRMVRFFLSVFLLLHSTFITYITITIIIVASIVHIVESLVPIWWIVQERRERRDKLDFFRLYVKMNDLFDEAELNNGTINKDAHTSWGDAAHYIPRGVMEIGRVVFETQTWGQTLPCLFEGIALVLFLISCSLRFLLSISILPSPFPLTILLLSLPFVFTVFHNMLSLLQPFDILWAIELNDKLITYNQYGIVFHNRTLEQYEREIEYGGALVEKWEPCMFQKRSVVVFDQINDISLAISEELGPYSKKLLNLPWIYVSSINSIGREYRNILPIRIPIVENQYRSILGNIISPFSRHLHFLKLPAIYDGLTVKESVEFLKILRERRPDLQDKLKAIQDQLNSQVQIHGYEFDS